MNVAGGEKAGDVDVVPAKLRYRATVRNEAPVLSSGEDNARPLQGEKHDVFTGRKATREKKLQIERYTYGKLGLARKLCLLRCAGWIFFMLLILESARASILKSHMLIELMLLLFLLFLGPLSAASATCDFGETLMISRDGLHLVAGFPALRPIDAELFKVVAQYVAHGVARDAAVQMAAHSVDRLGHWPRSTRASCLRRPFNTNITTFRAAETHTATP